jgi:hypothetical protein
MAQDLNLTKKYRYLFPVKTSYCKLPLHQNHVLFLNGQSHLISVAVRLL